MNDDDANRMKLTATNGDVGVAATCPASILQNKENTTCYISVSEVSIDILVAHLFSNEYAVVYETITRVRFPFSLFLSLCICICMKMRVQLTKCPNTIRSRT